jgi:hypothetical protein
LVLFLQHEFGTDMLRGDCHQCCGIAEISVLPSSRVEANNREYYEKGESQHGVVSNLELAMR